MPGVIVQSRRMKRFWRKAEYAEFLRSLFSTMRPLRAFGVAAGDLVFQSECVPQKSASFPNAQKRKIRTQTFGGIARLSPPVAVED
jgi:hypothetical protein